MLSATPWLVFFAIPFSISTFIFNLYTLRLDAELLQYFLIPTFYFRLSHTELDIRSSICYPNRVRLSVLPRSISRL